MAQARAVLTVRLTETGKELLEKLADHYGNSQTSVIERLVREEAKRAGVAVSAAAIVEKEPATA